MEGEILERDIEESVCLHGEWRLEFNRVDEQTQSVL